MSQTISEAPAKARPTSEASSEVIPLDIPDGQSDEDVWIHAFNKDADPDELRLLKFLWRTDHEMTPSLLKAQESDHPDIMRGHLRSVVRGIKVMSDIIKQLDRRRHRIAGHHSSRPPSLAEGKDKGLQRSDAMIADLFLNRVDNLEFFEEYCRKHARILNAMPLSELLGVMEGLRIGPNRRNWEQKFIDLAIYVTGQTVKLRALMEKRGKHQVFRKLQTADILALEKGKAATRNKADAQSLNVDFAIGKNIKKARRMDIQ